MLINRDVRKNYIFGRTCLRYTACDREKNFRRNFVRRRTVTSRGYSYRLEVKVTLSGINEELTARTYALIARLHARRAFRDALAWTFHTVLAGHFRVIGGNSWCITWRLQVDERIPARFAKYRNIGQKTERNRDMDIIYKYSIYFYIYKKNIKS